MYTYTCPWLRSWMHVLFICWLMLVCVCHFCIFIFVKDKVPPRTGQNLKGRVEVELYSFLILVLDGGAVAACPKA